LSLGRHGQFATVGDYRPRIRSKAKGRKGLIDVATSPQNMLHIGFPVTYCIISSTTDCHKNGLSIT